MMKGKLIVSAVILSSIASFVSGCSGESKPSAKTPPPVPSGVAATRGDLEDGVKVTWNAVDGADSYIVYKSVDTRDSYVALAESKELTFTDTPVTPSRHFYYRVAAASGNAWSAASEDVLGYALKGTPQPPQTVSVPQKTIHAITLTWTASEKTDSYTVLRSDKMYGTYDIIATGLKVLTYTDSCPSDPAVKGIVPDTKYYYEIVAVNANGDGGAPSVPISAAALQAVPEIPAGIKATKGDFGDIIQISWTPSSRAAYYLIFKALQNYDGTPGTFAQLMDAQGKEIQIKGEVYADTICETDGSKYCYTVAAVSSGGQSAQGEPDYGNITVGAPKILNPPANVKATKGLANTITVTWGAIADPELLKYTVYRSASATGPYAKVAGGDISAGSNSTAFSDVYKDDGTGTLPSVVTTYYYKVSATSQSKISSSTMEGSQSSASEGFANPTVPLVPTGLSASSTIKEVLPVPSAGRDFTGSTITLTWAAPARAKTYNVYVSDSKNGVYNQLSMKQAANSWTGKIGTTPQFAVGTEYYFKIEAVNEGGASAMSAAQAAMLLPQPISKKPVISSTVWEDTLVWTPSLGATGYEIQWENTIGGKDLDPKSTSDWANKKVVTDGKTVTTTVPQSSSGTTHIRIRAINTNIPAHTAWSFDNWVYCVWGVKKYGYDSTSYNPNNGM